MARVNKENITLEDVSKKIKNSNIGSKIVPTNIIALDTLLKGGLELGNIVQFISESSMGKTTIALQISKNLCCQGHNVVYLDAEGSISKELVNSIGLEEYINKQFFYLKESSFKKVEEYLDMYISTSEISFIIIDSIACLINDCFLDLKKGKSITDNSTIYNSRPLVMFMNKYNALAKAKNICFIILNQYRNKIDTTKGTILKEYGNKNVKYNSDIIIKVSPITSNGAYTEFKNMTKYSDNGKNLEFEIVKSNKIRPEIKIPFYLVYGSGISNFTNYVYALIKLNVISQSTGYFKITIDNTTYNTHGLNELLPKIQQQYERCLYNDMVMNYYYNLLS